MPVVARISAAGAIAWMLLWVMAPAALAHGEDNQLIVEGASLGPFAVSVWADRSADGNLPLVFEIQFSAARVAALDVWTTTENGGRSANAPVYPHPMLTGHWESSVPADAESVVVEITDSQGTSRQTSFTVGAEWSVWWMELAVWTALLPSLAFAGWMAGRGRRLWAWSKPAVVEPV